ncbi:21726_t:CDS:2 [Gigaspora margarita]|uniref:21726_t:CDS:1 n=1 Tax=Gigaspora margarita TaxID=4874 RepID=A0ABM8VVC0_GIGMA|nr:21726_t:CDS:2 [Gigaspora margarita]
MGVSKNYYYIPRKIVKKATDRNYYKRQIRSILIQHLKIHNDSCHIAKNHLHSNLVLILRPAYLNQDFAANREIEDKVYDQYFKELEQLERDYSFILPDSPTQKAGYLRSKKLAPVYRQIPMLSLDSVDSFSELLRFDERVKKILGNKENVDLVYQNHRLVQISTRGNGLVGENVTFNKDLIKNIPFFLPEISDCEVRGEIYMKKEEFFCLNEELERNSGRLLANPRNAAAGSLRALVSLQDRSLHFFAYQFFLAGFFSKIETQLECLQRLEKAGFTVSPDYYWCQNIQEVQKFLCQQEKKTRRFGL